MPTGPDSTAEQVQPDPAPILDLLGAFRESKVLFAAVSLGVFDALADGPRTAGELAGAIGADAGALRRLLDACVGLDLLEREGDRFANPPVASAYLTSAGGLSLTGYIRYSNDVLWKIWAHLEDAVREGSHRWRQAFGWDGPIFTNFYHTEEAKREFLMGMHGMGVISSPHVLAAFDLGRFRHLVDLGGATGHLAIAACIRHPGLRATVYDLPAAAPLAREILDLSPVADRVAIASGDFFTDPLPPADLYALGRILHDWDEPRALGLLGRIFQVLPPGGALLIAEKLLDDDRSGPRWAQVQSLNMLCCTEGKERTADEYRTLLHAAGFSAIQCCVTPSPLDAILAWKP